MTNTNLLVIFFTGLLTGGLTCLAVQGGLLATTIAQREEEKELEKDKSTKGAAAPIVYFLLAKLVAYTILGFLLGWFGSLFKLSLAAEVIFQFAVAIFMVGTALALLDAHPFFRHFIIQPPKILTRLVRKQSKSRGIFAPTVLGAFTVFLPCGTTQAMMALAIASGSFFKGASIMFAFILGTIPLFFILGYFTTRLGDLWHKRFLKVAAYAIIILAIFNLNNSIALTGTKWTFGSLAKSAFCTIAYCESVESDTQKTNQPIVSEATIEIENNGYSPKSLNVKAGSNITLHLINKNGWSCAQAFTIPKLNIQKIVRPGSSADIVFTAPKEKGQITFMCSMGMYRGTIFIN